MPLIETPPELPKPDASERPSRRGGRYGEMEHHELIHLLDEVDDERARARFREAIYVSLIIWLVIGWLGVYGVRYLPHPPRLESPNEEHGNPRDREMTYLETPRDLPRSARPATRAPAPTPSPKVSETAPAVRAPAARQPAPAQRQLLPSAPQPQTQAPPAMSAPPPPPARQETPTPTLPTVPKQTQQAAVDAPKPAPTRPNFGQQGQTAGDAIRRAAQAAAQDGGGLSGITGAGGGSGVHSNLNTPVQVLSDMQGVNFNPYLRTILQQIYRTWLPLIPEEARPPLNKQGETLVRFKILPDGRIGGMYLDGSTHDDALNRAAWGSITGVGTFPPLPKEFHGPNLELRIRYMVNEKPE